MSFFDSALDIVSTITKAIPGLNALSGIIDAVKSLMNTIQPMLNDTAQSAASGPMSDQSPQNQEKVTELINAFVGAVQGVGNS